MSYSINSEHSVFRKATVTDHAKQTTRQGKGKWTIQNCYYHGNVFGATVLVLVWNSVLCAILNRLSPFLYLLRVNDSRAIPRVQLQLPAHPCIFCGFHSCGWHLWGAHRATQVWVELPSKSLVLLLNSFIDKGTHWNYFPTSNQVGKTKKCKKNQPRQWLRH